MKTRGTYLLLALFFAGLLGLWAVDQANLPTRDRLERMSNRILPELIDTKPDELRKIELLGGDSPLVFERQDGNRWQMTSPMDVAADPSKVEALAYNLKELSRKPDSASIQGDPDRYGLAPPERVIRLWGRSTDAPLASLELGKVSLDRRFVRPVGSESFEAVAAKGLDLTRLPPVRWRDHELFRLPSFEVEALNLTEGDWAVKLKRARDAWRVVEPVRVLASEARVDTLIADLGSLKVLDDVGFVANDVKPGGFVRYGLDAPGLVIELVSGRPDGRRGTQVLHVGKPVEGKSGQVYARLVGQDDVVAVEDRIFKGLKAQPNLFRSPKVADIAPTRVSKIRVEGADGVIIEAAKLGNEWGIVAPSRAKADRQAIQDFLKGLGDLQTGTYLDPKLATDTGLDHPSLQLKIWQAPHPRDLDRSTPADPAGNLACILRIGRRDAGKRSIFAQLDGDPTILALPDSATKFLPANPLAFRDRQILEVDTDAVERIKLSSPSRSYLLNAPLFRVGRKNMGLAPVGWWLVEPTATPADSPSVAKLLGLLANLRAEALVTDKASSLDRFGLLSPTLTVTWFASPSFSMVENPKGGDVSPGSVELRQESLLIGSPLPDRPNARYAQIGGWPLIFILGPESLATLDAEWHDHRVLTFDPAHVRSVELEWADRKLSLLKEAANGESRWSLAPGSDAPGFAVDVARSITQAASQLTTRRFAQYSGPIPPGIGLDPARLMIRFEFDDGTSPKTIRLGASVGGGQAYATTDVGNQGAIFLMPDAPFAPWRKAARHRDDLPDDVFAP